MTVASDLVSSNVRWAISRSASSSVAPDSSSLRISADASSHCWRSWPCSNRSAFCTAIPAAVASASTTTSSSGGELPTAVLLGEVQVAEHGVAHPDGHAEEAAHRRMVRRETDRRLVRAQIRQPQRMLADDELAEQPLALREMAHPRPGLLVQPDVDEPGHAAVGCEHPQRPVPRVDEVHRGLHDAAQRRVQFQAIGDGEDRVEQTLHPAPRRDDLGEPLLHLAQQLVEPQTGLHVRHRTWRRLVVTAVRHLEAPCAHTGSLLSRRAATVPRPTERDNRPVAAFAGR